MSLMRCRECGNSVSSEAKMCPRCGVPKPQPPPEPSIWLSIGIIAFFPVCFYAFAYVSETNHKEWVRKQDIVRNTPPPPPMKDFKRPTRVARPQKHETHPPMISEQATETIAVAKDPLTSKGSRDIQTFISLLNTLEIDPPMIVGCQYERIGRTATITVGDMWHYEPKRIRTQTAKHLWQAWAQIHSPGNRDSARIKLVDSNGDTVGGSRVWAGSLMPMTGTGLNLATVARLRRSWTPWPHPPPPLIGL